LPPQTIMRTALFTKQMRLKTKHIPLFNHKSNYSICYHLLHLTINCIFYPISTHSCLSFWCFAMYAKPKTNTRIS